jgi:hypothetical protein
MMTVVHLDNGTARIEWDYSSLRCPHLIVPEVYLREHPPIMPSKSYVTNWSDFEDETRRAQMNYTLDYHKWRRAHGIAEEQK